jgi:hypothetical protein
MSGTRAKPVVDELSQETAPDEFKRAIVRDPFASTFRFDFDAMRGDPANENDLYPGGSTVPLSGFYFDYDGEVVNWYNEGDRFPHLSPVAGAGGRYQFITDRRNATTSDLRWIILRRGWGGGDIRDVHIR